MDSAPVIRIPLVGEMPHTSHMQGSLWVIALRPCYGSTLRACGMQWRIRVRWFDSILAAVLVDKETVIHLDTPLVEVVGGVACELVEQVRGEDMIHTRCRAGRTPLHAGNLVLVYMADVVNGLVETRLRKLLRWLELVVHR